MSVLLEASEFTVRNEEKTEQKTPDEAYYFDMFQKKRIQFTKTIVSTTLLTILVFGGTGYAVDYFFGLKHIGLITGIIVSFPLSLYLNIRRLRKLI